jgi:hypothetical protein
MRAIAAVVAVALGAAPALAQRAERPDVRVGDRWEFVVWYTVPSTAPNRTWVVDAVTPTNVRGTENGEPLLLTADLNVLDSPLVRSSNPTLLRFPLEVGHHWTFADDYLFKPKRSAGRAVTDVLVVAYEKVVVPAGEFDAFRLEAKSRLSGTSPIDSRIDAEALTTYWYAPEARAVVKSVQRRPYLGPATVELVSHARQP